MSPPRSHTIRSAIPHACTSVDVPQLGTKTQGKVRDIYLHDDKRILITTDRQSAFDRILGAIPFKGSVLTLLSQFWFERTKHIIPNHMIDVVDSNVMVVHDCQPIPVEVIVRGYMTGVTNTSIWHSYQRGERHIYGIDFPDGLEKNDKLPQPVITPTTHGGGTHGHDERLTKQDITDENIVSKDLYEQIEQAALALFQYGSDLCAQNGLILVDTKYEFGLINGNLMIMDEIHTPDSSRFWVAETYAKRRGKGLEPENYDKEFLRLWFKEKGYTGDGEPPQMTEDFIVQVAERYIDTYERVTGKPFEMFPYPIEERIRKNIELRSTV